MARDGADQSVAGVRTQVRADVQADADVDVTAAVVVDESQQHVGGGGDAIHGVTGTEMVWAFAIYLVISKGYNAFAAWMRCLREKRAAQIAAAVPLNNPDG